MPLINRVSGLSLKMHQNGKEDSSGGDGRGEANEASPTAFNSNTFPLLSRSSMKRPFSLSSEREHQSPALRDHSRCRGFRSRSKTVHSDTFARSPQYRDLLGQSNNLFAGLTNNSNSDRSTITRYFESTRRKPSSTRSRLSTDKKSHVVISEPILDEDMAVDDEEGDEGAQEDGQLTMLLNTEQSLPPSVVEPTRRQVTSLDIFKGKHHNPQHHPHNKNIAAEKPMHSCATKLDFNSNPTAALFANAKSKVNLLLGHNTIPSLSGGQLVGHARNHNASNNHHNSTCQQSSEPLIGPKVAITFPSKPTTAASTAVECDETSDFLFASRAPKPSSGKKATDDDADGQQPLDSPSSSSEGATPQLAIQNSLSPLAVPKSATSFWDSKALGAVAPLVATIPAHIPTEAEKAQFQRSLDSATTLVFHRRSGLPLTSSPAPIRKCGTCFDFDSSLTSVNAIKKALFEKDTRDSVTKLRSRVSFTAPTTTSALLGNFEESVLNGRLEPASIVNGFSAEIGASGTFCPKHKTLPVTVFFYTLQDSDKAEKISSPYLGHINLGPKGYHVPRQGTVQVTLFNPNGTVVKMFVVRYNLSDMPPNSRTFLRQRTLFMPSDASEHHADNRKWLRYLIHLRFQSSKSGRIRLHTDIRILVFRKHDLDVATLNGGVPYELRSFIQMPSNPKYSKNIKS